MSATRRTKVQGDTFLELDQFSTLSVSDYVTDDDVVVVGPSGSSSINDNKHSKGPKTGH